MKWFIVFLLVSVNGFAVEVRNCPEKIKINASELNVEKTLKEVMDVEGGFDEIEGDQKKAIQISWDNLFEVWDLNRDYTLSSAKNGNCKYSSSKNVTVGSEERVMIYTKQGKDLLQVQTNFGPRGIVLRFYAHVQSLTLSKIVTRNFPGIALGIPRYPYDDYVAGGNLIFVGSAGKFKVTAK